MTDTNAVRAAQITSVASHFKTPAFGGAYTGMAPGVWIGSSHIERAPLSSLKGRPVILAGIAGASFPTLQSYIPMSALMAVQPAWVAIQGGVNDAWQKLTIDQSWINIVKSCITSAGQMGVTPIIATDPPPEQIGDGALVDLAIFNKVNSYLWSLAHSQYYWNGTDEPLAFPLPWLNFHDILHGPSNDYMAAGSSLDGVHLTFDKYQTAMIPALAAAVP